MNKLKLLLYPLAHVYSIAASGDVANWILSIANIVLH